MLKTRSVVFIFNFLRPISGIEIILKFPAIIDLVKGIGTLRVYIVVTVQVGVRSFITSIEGGTFGNLAFDLG